MHKHFWNILALQYFSMASKVQSMKLRTNNIYNNEIKTCKSN